MEGDVAAGIFFAGGGERGESDEGVGTQVAVAEGPAAGGGGEDCVAPVLLVLEKMIGKEEREGSGEEGGIIS